MKVRRSERLKDKKSSLAKYEKVEDFWHSQRREGDVVVGRVSTEDKENFLEYVLKDNVMDMIHTYVSPARRGQRLAGKIVRAGFKLAVRREWKIRPSCTYISKTFLPRSEGKWSAHIASSL